MLESPSREWAIESLVRGYPIEQLIAILECAEKQAFEILDLPRLLRLRSLKIRALDGPEFQTVEWPSFIEASVTMSKDSDAVGVLRADMYAAPHEIFPFIIASTPESGRSEIVRVVINELNRRVSLRRNAISSGEDSPTELAHTIVSVLASSQDGSVARAMEYVQRLPESESFIATYARTAIVAGHFQAVLEVAKHWSGRSIDRDVLASLCFEGISPSTQPMLKARAHPALRCLDLLSGGKSRRARTKRALDHIFNVRDGGDFVFSEETKNTLYEIFFATLGVGLSGGKSVGWCRIPPNAEGTWLNSAVRALESLAADFAEKWSMESRWPSLARMYDRLNLQIPDTGSRFDERCLIAFRLALADIAIDLCTMGRFLDPKASISARDLEAVAASPFWLDMLWLDAFTVRRLLIHERTAAKVLCERIDVHMESTIIEFNERTDTATKLAMFAMEHGLVVDAQNALRRAAGCLLGYGWRKDTFASEILVALDLLMQRGEVEAREAVLKLAGAYEAITRYTDGDHTTDIRAEYYRTIVNHFPEHVPACYAELIQGEHWRFADAVAIAFATSNHVRSRSGRALLQTYISPPEISSVQASNVLEDQERTSILSVIERRTGRVDLSSTQDGKQTWTSVDDGDEDDRENDTSRGPLPRLEEYPPGRLRELLEAMQDMNVYVDRGNLVSMWLRYWEATGRMDRALVDLENVYSETRYRLHLREALHVAFEMSLMSEGRSKAFPWLVRAHVANAGWDGWLEPSSEARTRIDALAHHYPDRWQEFVKGTAKPLFATGAHRNGIAIGLSRFVYMLLEVGELQIAKAYALAMAQVFDEEVADQPVRTPEWLM